MSSAAADNSRRGLIAWFARNNVAANLLMIMLMIGGLISVQLINKEVFPSFDLDKVMVRVAYPGAAPQEIEEGIVIKIEEQIRDVDGIKRFRSSASEGAATITIDVDEDYDPKEVLDEVKQRVDAISTFPDSIEQPNIYQLKVTPDVMKISVTGEALSAIELKELAKTVRDEITALPGVTRATLFGERAYEIAIEVSEDKLREYRLTFDDVASAVQRSSLNLPGGSIRAENGDILLRSDGQAYTGDDFAQIVLRSLADGTRLYLADVANIVDGFEERLGYTRFDGKNAIGIQISSVDDQNVLIIADTVKAYLKDKQQTLPAGVSVDYWSDRTQFLEGRLNLMLSNMLQGAILVFLVLALFLQLKVAFWVMMGLPISFLAAMFFMPLEPWSLSVNMITLFGFILVLGIVVDDAIVIGESAYAQIEKDGHSAESVIYGTQKVAMPATFGVLTTVAAFIPMLNISGFMGAITASIAGVVILCLLFSLVESKLILPAHLVNMRPPKPNQGWQPWLRFKKRFDQGVQAMIQQGYKPLIGHLIHWRYSVLSFFIGLMLLCAGLLASGLVRTISFPDIPSDVIQVNVSMESGVSEQQTLQVVQQLEEALFASDAAIAREIGFSVVRHSSAWLSSRTEAAMVIELIAGEERPLDGVEIASRWRDSLPELVGLKILDVKASTNSGGGDVAFRLNGTDLEQLIAAADKLKQKLASYDGLYDIQDNFSSGSQEVRLAVKPEAQALGITLSDLARQVRYGFFGFEAQRILRNKEEIKVMVRYPAAQRTTLGHLENMRIRTQNGSEVPFSSVATIELAQGYAAINRTNGVRSITVEADAHKGRVEPGKIIREIQQDFLPELLAQYPSLTSELDGAAEEDAENNLKMIQGAFLAFFTIYALMAVPLRSYTQPLIIMSVIPFGMIGAVVGHLVLGLDMSMLSLFGIIALSGVVVNDSLILVDFINRGQQQGLSLHQAVTQAGSERFRAIVLTSLTTFLGLVPITLETSLQAQIVIPMAVSLAFGILFSTFVTLVLIPTLYLILDDIKRLLHWWWQPQGKQS